MIPRMKLSGSPAVAHIPCCALVLVGHTVQERQTPGLPFGSSYQCSLNYVAMVAPTPCWRERCSGFF